MIKAFQEKLRALSNDPQDPFFQQIRMFAGAKEAPRFEAPLRAMILRMPEMLSHISQWALNATASPQVRTHHQFVLTYLYNPKDFMPEKTEGLFGYVDDAYLVSWVYQRSLGEPGILSPRSKRLAAGVQELKQWISLTQELLPQTTSIIERALHRHETGYFTAKAKEN